MHGYNTVRGLCCAKQQLRTVSFRGQRLHSCSTPFLAGWHLRDCTLQRFHATVYKRTLKLPRSTSNLLVLLEMGRYPMQIQWLQRTLSYCNKLVANKANSKLLHFVLAAEVHQGLREDHDCWAKELLEGLRFVDPSKDWKTHMQQMRPIENPRGVAGLAKQKFAGSYTGSLIPTPQILSARTASAAPTATLCTMLMTVGCWFPQHTSVLTCRFLKRKPSLQYAWPLPQLSAIPSTAASHTHNASANGVELE